jgi:hypothetical protein
MMYAKIGTIASSVSIAIFWLLTPCVAVLVSGAQTPQAVLVGSVLDPSEHPVQNVRVFLIEDATKSKRQAWTGANGDFFFSRLNAGSYTLQTVHTGFALVQIPAIILQAGETRSLQIHFQLGTTEETALVQAGAFEDASVITTRIDHELVDDIPLNGRSLQTLLLLTPGVIMMANNEFSFNGQATNMNYFTVDGMSANMAAGGGGVSTDLAQDAGYSALGTTSSLVSIGDLDEFTVQSSTISPQIGRQSGGHVQMSSRSGGDKLHGEAFDFFRNSALDSDDWFLPAQTVENADLRQNDFGGALSGPIPQFPRWIRRNYFFLSEESVRLFQPTVLKTYVPSSAQRALAPSKLLPFLNVFPDSANPEVAGTGTSMYRLAISNPSSEDNYSIRLDTDTERRASVFARYNHSLSSRVSTDEGWYLSDTDRSSQSVTTGVMVKFSPRMVSDFRFNYGKNTGNVTNTLHQLVGATLPGNKVLLQGISSKVKLPNLSYDFLGATYSSGSTGQNPVHQINLTENVTAERGRHIFGAGFDLLRLIGETVPSDFNMTVSFLSQSSLTSGVADSIAIQSQDDVRVEQKISSFYAQDSWKIFPRVNLDYGVRWDISPAPAANNGQSLYTVTSSNDIPHMTLAPAGTDLYPTLYTNLCPRIGQSWLMRSAPGTETILHSGAGAFYSLGNTSSMAAASAFPHVRQDTLLARIYPPSSTLPIPNSTSLLPPYSGQAFFAITDGYSTPVVYQISTGIEQHFGGDRKLSVAYVGSESKHLPVMQQLTDPNSNFTHNTSITEVRSEGASSYQSLQTQYRQMLASRVHVLGSYTWAHSIDNVSNDLNGFSRKVLIPFKGERANSSFDVRQNAGLALTYESKVPTQDKLAKWLLDGWNLGSLAMIRGGMPLDITYTRPIGSQLLPTRPDRVEKNNLFLNHPTQPYGKIYNYDAFAIPATDRQGHLGRNALRDHGAWQADFSVHRSFALYERLQLDARAEFINALNHPNFGGVDGNLGTYADGTLTRNPTFGYITSMLDTQLGGLQQAYQVGGPRSVQLSLKLFF